MIARLVTVRTVWISNRLCGAKASISKLTEPSLAGVIKASQETLEGSMNGLIYLVGLVVVILAVLSFFGLR